MFDQKSSQFPRTFPDQRGYLSAVDRKIAQLCTAHTTLGVRRQQDRLAGLLEAGAWTDASLALLRLKAPEWQVRRIELDDGEWFCALSRHPAVPREFDEVAEGRGNLLPLAILAASTEAEGRAPEAVHAGRAMASPATTSWLENVR